MNKIPVLYNGSEYLINLDFIECVYYNVVNDNHRLIITFTSGEKIELEAKFHNEDYENQKEAIIKLWGDINAD